MKIQTPKIILLHETVLQSIVKDFSTMLSIFILVGLGVLVHSVVIQIFGALMAAIWILAKVGSAIKKQPVLTPQAAADYLKKHFNVVAK